VISKEVHDNPKCTAKLILGVCKILNNYSVIYLPQGKLKTVLKLFTLQEKLFDIYKLKEVPDIKTKKV
jgi:hypothetical protein